MLVVVDDLFVSPLDMPRDTMEARIKYEIAKSKYARLGAILLLNPVCYIDEVDYRTHFIENPAANAGCAIPATVAEGFLAGNSDFSDARRNTINESEEY